MLGRYTLGKDEIRQMRDTFRALDPGGTGAPVLPYRGNLPRKYPCPAVQGYLTYKKVPLSCRIGAPRIQETEPTVGLCIGCEKPSALSTPAAPVPLSCRASSSLLRSSLELRDTTICEP